MCYISAEKPEILTAEEDILCWKELMKDFRPMFLSEYPPYKCGELVTAKKRGVEIKNLEVINDGDKYKVFAGIHSYAKENARIYFPNFRSKNYDTILVPFIIPKGTEYITDGYFNVSLSIMRIKKIKSWKISGKEK